MKENFWPLVALLLIAVLLSHLGDATGLGFLVDLFISFIITSAFLRISRGHKIDSKNIFADVSGMKLVHYALASIIAGIFFVIGLVLLVIPGIIVGIMLSFVTYILVDEAKDVTWKSHAFWASIKKSATMTKGVRWKLFLFFIVLVGVNLVGLLALGVGLLVTVPVSGIAMATLYDRLKGKGDITVVVPISNIPESAPSETVS